MTSGMNMLSMKETWFEARMTGPSPGTFSRPLAFGRYIRRRNGPMTMCLSNQYIMRLTPPGTGSSLLPYRVFERRTIIPGREHEIAEQRQMIRARGGRGTPQDPGPLHPDAIVREQVVDPSGGTVGPERRARTIAGGGEAIPHPRGDPPDR